jgi:uncharacterized protein (DUF302 family)
MVRVCVTFRIREESPTMNPVIAAAVGALAAIRALAVLAVLLTSPAIHADAQPLEAVVTHRVTGTYADLRERVVFAIEEKGLVVGHVAKIGEMLRRTAAELKEPPPPFAEAEVIEFCSARLSRDVTLADPRYVAFCPYAISLYSLEAEPGVVHVGYRRPLAPGANAALAAALQRAEALLAGIVASAIE